MKIIHPLDASRAVQGLRQADRRRHPDVRPARAAARRTWPAPPPARSRPAFISVGINDVLDMWIGNSEKNLHELFEQARRNKPCVLFFDEVDALGASRADMRHSGGRHLINQFLAELDGVEASQRRRADPRRDERPVAPRPRLPPARAVRPHPVRPAARRAGPRRDPAAHAHRQAGRRRSTSTSSRRRPTTSPAPTSRRSSTWPSRRKLRDAMKAGMPEPLRTKDLLAAAAQRQALAPRSGSPPPATTPSTPTRAARTTTS